MTFSRIRQAWHCGSDPRLRQCSLWRYGSSPSLLYTAGRVVAPTWYPLFAGPFVEKLFEAVRSKSYLPSNVRAAQQDEAVNKDIIEVPPTEARRRSMDDDDSDESDGEQNYKRRRRSEPEAPGSQRGGGGRSIPYHHKQDDVQVCVICSIGVRSTSEFILAVSSFRRMHGARTSKCSLMHAATLAACRMILGSAGGQAAAHKCTEVPWGVDHGDRWAITHTGLMVGQGWDLSMGSR